MIVTCGSSVWFPDEQNTALLFENFAAGISVGEKVDLKIFQDHFKTRNLLICFVDSLNRKIVTIFSGNYLNGWTSKIEYLKYHFWNYNETRLKRALGYNEQFLGVLNDYFTK